MNKITLLFLDFFFLLVNLIILKLSDKNEIRTSEMIPYCKDFKWVKRKRIFFNSCWELNKKGLFIQSDDNKYFSKTLLSKDPDNTADDIELLFCGSFNENNIMTGMDHKFGYLGRSFGMKSIMR
ncbi:hypothetical protein N9483_01190 [Flavobacteriaceae bacterium]|nr:hypothetical protein [Flavobacteriaceae bacterium]